jgi:hypothetical protein
LVMDLWYWRALRLVARSQPARSGEVACRQPSVVGNRIHRGVSEQESDNRRDPVLLRKESPLPLSDVIPPSLTSAPIVLASDC